MKQTPSFQKIQTQLAKRWRVGIIVARFNEDITTGLFRECVKELVAAGLLPNNIHRRWVPGAYELPYAADLITKKKNYDAVICLGCVIKGQTAHDFFIAMWAAVGIGLVSLKNGIPVIFGVLTPNSERQARARCKPGALNRGREAAQAALQMLLLKSGR